MTLDLGIIELWRVIVHLVYKPIKISKDTKTQEPPTLTKEITELGRKEKEFLRKKFIQHIDSNKAIPVISKEDSTKKIIPFVKRLQALKLNTSNYDSFFIELSKDIAQNYSDSLDARNKDCLVMLLEIKKRNEIKHVIMIFELQIGLEASLDEIKETIKIGYIDGLILSENTRLFKIAYCVFDDEFDAIVCDTQSTTEIIAANFFIEDFLECKFIEIPSVKTREFFREALAYINRIGDSEKIFSSSIELFTYLQSDSDKIDPKSFADKLPSEFKPGFLEHFNKKNISLSSFEKDLARIETNLGRESIEFEHGITLSAPPKMIKEKVKIKKTDDNSVSVSFKSRIRRIR